jgi:uncharacterized repeat protein (TIGR03803 family)
VKSRIMTLIACIALFAAAAIQTRLAGQEQQATTFTVLYTFSRSSNGSGPIVSFRDSAGNLYGVTSRGGPLVCFNHVCLPGCQGLGCGVVFKLDSTNKETVLHSFTGADGRFPTVLLRDAAGNLYGTTFLGGSTACGGNGCGVIFKLDTTGKETLLHIFGASAGGWFPSGPLLRDSAGNFYGATVAGGDLACSGLEGSGTGCGVVFKVDTTGKETVLHTFTGTNGASPGGGLLRDSAGNFYGTTFVGGSNGRGVIFKLDASGKETLLHSFAGVDGSYPTSLLRDSAGNLYGGANLGGSSTCSGGCGVLFRLDSTDKETVLHRFMGPDGSHPWGGLLRDSTGNLYGTTGSGGDLACPHTGGCGVVFKLDTTGKETVLHSFTGGADGWYPIAGLLQDSAGNRYGTTSYGGQLTCPSSASGTGCGVIFKVVP